MGKGNVDVTFEIYLKGTVPAPQPVYKSNAFLPEHSLLGDVEKRGGEGCGEGNVYLISSIGDTPRDLHFYLVIIAAPWNRIFIITRDLKRKEEKRNQG